MIKTILASDIIDSLIIIKDVVIQLRWFADLESEDIVIGRLGGPTRKPWPDPSPTRQATLSLDGQQTPQAGPTLSDSKSKNETVNLIW